MKRSLISWYHQVVGPTSHSWIANPRRMRCTERAMELYELLVMSFYTQVTRDSSLYSKDNEADEQWIPHEEDAANQG